MRNAILPRCHRGLFPIPGILKIIVLHLMVLGVASTSVVASERPTYRLKYLFSINAITTEKAFGSISALYMDNKNGELLILDVANSRVVIVDQQGLPIHHFLIEKGVVSDITVDGSGDILTAGGDKVRVYNYRGKYKGLLDLSSVPDADSISLQSIKTGKNGRIYLGTRGKKARIITLDSKGKYISQIEAKGRFINVRGLSVLDDSFLFLASGYFKVIRIEGTGDIALSFGQVSSLPGGFSMPIDLDVDEMGRMYVVDTNRFRVIIFDSNGKLIWEFGGSTVFRWPRSIAVSDKGVIYVADGTNNVRVFEVEDISQAVLPVVDVVEEGSQVKEPKDDEVAKIVEEEARLLPVYFDLDSAKLDEDDMEVLNKDSEWLRKNPDVRINVQGYADEGDSDEYNLKLSERRAKTVMDYFIEVGIEEARLKVVPHGRVMTMEKTEEAMDNARRVDFLVVVE